MREIISMHCGTIGGLIGWEFVHQVGFEHRRGKRNGDPRVHLEGGWEPREAIAETGRLRGVFVDLDTLTHDRISASRSRRAIDCDRDLLNSRNVANTTFAQGYCYLDQEFVDEALERARVHAERCDALQGFYVTHSLHGGAGAGLGSRIVEQLRDLYPSEMVQSFSCLPTLSAQQPYDCILALSHLRKSAHCSMLFNSEGQDEGHSHRQTLHGGSGTGDGVQHISRGGVRITPAVSNVARTMCDTTSFMRFRGDGASNCSLRKLIYALVPLPGLPFVCTGRSGIPDKKNRTSPEEYFEASAVLRRAHDHIAPGALSASGIRELLHKAGMPVSAGRSEVASKVCICRGAGFNSDLNLAYDLQKTYKIHQHQHHELTEPFVPLVCNTPGVYESHSATMIVNGHVVASKVVPYLHSFHSLYRHKAYLHYYVTSGGLEEDDFEEAHQDIVDWCNLHRYRESTLSAVVPDERHEGDTDSPQERTSWDERELSIETAATVSNRGAHMGSSEFHKA